MKSVFNLGICLFFISFTSYADHNTLQSNLIRSLANYVEPSEPGCALAYGNNSDDIFHSSGLIKVGESQQINSKTPFLTASISKHFTGHLAVLLANQGKLNLDDNIQNHFPELGTKQPITFNQAMNHTSGIPDHWSIFELQGRTLTENYQQQDAIRLIQGDLVLEFAPGQQYKYSNGGYIALTQAIENIAKQKLNEVLAQKVNKQLGIQARYIDQADKLPSSLASGHIKTESGFKAYNGNSFIYGPGNIMINMLDFSQWAKYINHQLLLLPEYTNALSNKDHHNNYFAGLYIEADNDGKQFLQHAGYYENLTQSIVLIPESKEYALALCNRADFRPAKVLYEFLSDIGSLSFGNQQPANSENLAGQLTTGYYINATKTDIAMIYEQGNQLYYYGQLVSSPKPLTQVSANKWRAKLSTSEVKVKLIGSNKLTVSNNQNKFKYSLIDNNAADSVKAVAKQTFSNAIIGKVAFTFAREGDINFIDSVGKIPLTCHVENFCWSEEGYVVVKVINPQEIIVSTNDLKNIAFVKSGG